MVQCLGGFEKRAGRVGRAAGIDRGGRKAQEDVWGVGQIGRFWQASFGNDPQSHGKNVVGGYQKVQEGKLPIDKTGGGIAPSSRQVGKRGMIGRSVGVAKGGSPGGEEEKPGKAEQKSSFGRKRLQESASVFDSIRWGGTNSMVTGDYARGGVTS